MSHETQHFVPSESILGPNSNSNLKLEKTPNGTPNDKSRKRLLSLLTDYGGCSDATIPEIMFLIKPMTASILKEIASEAGFNLSHLLRDYIAWGRTDRFLFVREIKKICEAGADPNYDEGDSLLMAIMGSQFKAAKCLLDMGADIDANDSALIRDSSDADQLFFLIFHGAIIPSDCTGKITLRLSLEYMGTCEKPQLEMVHVCNRIGQHLLKELEHDILKISDETLDEISPNLSALDLVDMMKRVVGSSMPNKDIRLKKLAAILIKK